MVKIRLHSYPAKASGGGRFSVVFDLTGKPDEFAPRDMEVRNTAEAIAARDAYAAEAKATGKPLACVVDLAPGQRSPAGFKAATSGYSRYLAVNVA